MGGGPGRTRTCDNTAMSGARKTGLRQTLDRPSAGLRDYPPAANKAIPCSDKQVDVRGKGSIGVHRAACRAPTKEDTMPKLTDTQLVLLANAANRIGGSILPLPRKSKLDRETADNIFKDLIRRKLVAERTAAGTVQIWREDDAGQPVALTITPAGLRAIGAEPNTARARVDSKAKRAMKPKMGKASSLRGRRQTARNSPTRKIRAENALPSSAIRPGSKQAKLVELLRHAKGASLDEMVKATGWQRHSVRGVMSGVLKKKLGLTITSLKDEHGRVYRITGSGK